MAWVVMAFDAHAAGATQARAQSDISADSLTLWSADLGVVAAFDLRKAGSIEPAVRGYAFGADTLHGIPGGWRTTGAASLAWAKRYGPIELRPLVGIDDAVRWDSLRFGARIVWASAAVGGLGARAEIQSGWRPGWFTYSVRSSLAAAAFTFNGASDWAELGAVVEDRRGGERPATPLPVDMSPNLLTDNYAWWVHALSKWLSLGASVRFADALRDRHQPTEFVNGVPVYTDFPYPTPRDEVALGALLPLKLGPVRAKVSWPVYSTGLYRFEDPVLGNPPRFYRAEYLTVAELSLGAAIPLAESVVATVEGTLLSRPYVPGAWFTRDAWNQAGITLKLVHATKQEEKTR